MLMNVVPLPKRRADPHVIEYLEEILNDAENGDLDQIAIVSFGTDGSMSEFIALGNNPYEMLAKLNIMLSRLNQRLQDTE